MDKKKSSSWLSASDLNIDSECVNVSNSDHNNSSNDGNISQSSKKARIEVSDVSVVPGVEKWDPALAPMLKEFYDFLLKNNLLEEDLPNGHPSFQKLTKKFALHHFFFAYKPEIKLDTVYCRYKDCDDHDVEYKTRNDACYSHLIAHHSKLKKGSTSAHTFLLTPETDLGRVFSYAHLGEDISIKVLNDDLMKELYASVGRAYVRHLHKNGLCMSGAIEAAERMHIADIHPRTVKVVQEKLHEVAVKSLRRQLEDAVHVHLMTDSWEHADHHYQGVMASGVRLVDSTHVPFNVLLGLPVFAPGESRTGMATASLIGSLLEKFGLRKTAARSVLAADGAAVNALAAETTFLEHLIYIPCSAHMTNNAMHAAAGAIPVLERFLEALCSFCSLLNNCELFRYCMVDYCKALNQEFCKFVLFTVIRWASIYRMLRRFFNLWHKTLAVLNKDAMKNPSLSHAKDFEILRTFMSDNSNYSELNDLCAIFRQVSKTIDSLQSAQSTLSNVYFSVAYLISFLQSSLRKRIPDIGDASFSTLEKMDGLTVCDHFAFSLLSQMLFRFNSNIPSDFAKTYAPIDLHSIRPSTDFTAAAKKRRMEFLKKNNEHYISKSKKKITKTKTGQAASKKVSSVPTNFTSTTRSPSNPSSTLSNYIINNTSSNRSDASGDFETAQNIGVGGNTVVVAADALDEKVANKEEMDEKKRSFLSFKKDGGSWYVYPPTVRVHFHIPALDPAFSADHSTNDQWICMCSGLCAVLDFRCRTQIADVFRMDLRARVIAHVALEILSQLIKDGVVKTPAALQEAADAKQPVDLDQSIVSDKFPLPILPSKAKRPRDNDDESETSNIDKEDKMYEKMIDEVKHFLIAKKKLGIDIDPHTIVNVYKYWNKYGEDFPLLSPVAFYVLSIPPSSANIERLFSICAAMSHDNQWRRSALKFAVQLFLRYNYAATKEDVFRYIRAGK